jgi:hypothetical protein
VPDDPTASATAPEAAAPTSAPSEESASPQEQPAAPESGFDIEAFIRGRAAGVPQGSSSNPDGVVPTAELSETPDGESTPDLGDVNPSAQAQKLGRRGAAARIAELEAENARLQKAYEEANPPPPDASEEARAAIRDRESRYRRLRDKPESDTDWTNEDYEFLETERKRRAVVPELQQHYETVLADDLAAHRQRYDGWVTGFQQALLADLATARDVPGVDFEAVKAAKSFAERDRLMWAAGNAQREAENRALRTENEQLRRDLLGSVTVPPSGGRSGMADGFDIDTWIRRRSGVA